MFVQSLLLLGLCALRVVRADFAVVTNYPTPTATTTLDENEVGPAVTPHVVTFTNMQPVECFPNRGC
jgi:hypothetical protein